MRAPEIFMHHPVMTGIWVATYALWVIPEIVISRRRADRDAPKVDRGSKLVVILGINLAIFTAFLAADALPAFFVGPNWRQVFAVGIAVWLCGIAFRLYSVRVLGRFFTYNVAVSRGQTVVETGPYRWLRHPSYLGGLVAMAGFGLTLTNWLAVVLAILFVAAAYAYRIPIEEQALVAGLGPEYRAYMQRTWRMIPFVF